MDVHIISIGNELLIGDTINTNASWMGEFMTELGFQVKEVLTISDDLYTIEASIKRSMELADVTLVTGGLGPTHDDMTKKAVADLFGVSMRVDEEVLEFIKNIFSKRGIPFSTSNYEQAEVPINCEVLFNKMGTAPGMWFNVENKCLAVMPGIPYEMKYLMKEEVAPKLRETFGDIGYLYSRYLKTAGVGESTLSDMVLGDLSSYLTDGVSLAFLPSPGGVVLRLNGHGTTPEEAKQSVQSLSDIIYQKAAYCIYGEGKNYNLGLAVGEVLSQKNLKIATAESCTGGMIANELTNNAGSSAYMMGGIVAYDNSVKMSQLGVSSEDLERVGAVSKEVALQMAKGVAHRLGASIGVSTTGIAGPGGGSEEKPVGTVWVGYWSESEHFAVHVQFTKDRLINKSRTTRLALEMVRRSVSGISTMPYNLEKHLP